MIAPALDVDYIILQEQDWGYRDDPARLQGESKASFTGRIDPVLPKIDTRDFCALVEFYAE